MDTLTFVVAIALAWHVGMALLERSRYPRKAGPSLMRLLLLAEVDLLRTLRAELKRRTHSGQEPTTERKLLDVEHRLKELGEDGR